MTKYLVNRILRSICSIVIVVAVVMVMIYSALDRELVFSADPAISKQKNNDREVYKMQQWENYGYLDHISYNDFLKELLKNGEIDQETYNIVTNIGATAEKDDELVAQYVQQFTETMEADGYKVERLAGMMKKGTKKYQDGGKPQLYAHKDIPLINRLINYITDLVTVDNIHNVENIEGERGLTFTWYDPVYGGEKFSPAIMGNGTTHKYLFYILYPAHLIVLAIVAMLMR